MTALRGGRHATDRVGFAGSTDVHHGPRRHGETRNPARLGRGSLACTPGSYLPSVLELLKSPGVLSSLSYRSVPPARAPREALPCPKERAKRRSKATPCVSARVTSPSGRASVAVAAGHGTGWPGSASTAGPSRACAELLETGEVVHRIRHRRSSGYEPAHARELIVVGVVNALTNSKRIRLMARQLVGEVIHAMRVTPVSSTVDLRTTCLP